MKLTDTQSVEQRINIIEEALAEVLNRDCSMYVDGDGASRCVWVRDEFSDPYIGHDLYQIARELEVLLS